MSGHQPRGGPRVWTNRTATRAELNDAALVKAHRAYLGREATVGGMVDALERLERSISAAIADPVAFLAPPPPPRPSDR